MQRHCVKCGFPTSYNSEFAHRQGECQSYFEEQRRDLEEKQKSQKFSLSLDNELQKRLKVETKKFNSLDVQINQANQEIFDLEQENEKLMMQYDEIFGQGASYAKFEIPSDRMEVDEERK